MYRLKLQVKRALQSILGFEPYLFVFSIFKILTLPFEQDGEGEFNLFLAQLPPDGIAIDAGANIGVMSVLMARHMRRGVVHAFEPIPSNYRALQQIIALFRLRNVIAYPIALGDRDQEIEMVLPEQDRVKLQGYGHVVDETIEGYPEGEHFRVACRRLDSIDALADSDVHVTGIKIDVEGFEYFVLQGAGQLIGQHRPVIYCEVAENNRSRTLAFFTEHGYRIMVADGDRLAPYDADAHASRWNIFAIPGQSQSPGRRSPR